MMRRKQEELVIALVLSLIIVLTTHIQTASGGGIEKEHRTPGAQIVKNSLSCYQCDTMVDGDKCSNLALGNNSSLIKKCHGDKLTCMVKRYSYTTSTENMTSVMRMWSLQRNCTAKCEPGCIVIGERTKLYACTACCSTYACNYGKGAASVHFINCYLVLGTLLSSFLISAKSLGV